MREERKVKGRHRAASKAFEFLLCALFAGLGAAHPTTQNGREDMGGSAPVVSGVTPLTATLNQTTTFTVSGTGLTSGMGFFIADCAGVTELSGGSATARQFSCTPGSTTGQKTGQVKTAPGGTLLYSFTVNIQTSSPGVREESAASR